MDGIRTRRAQRVRRGWTAGALVGALAVAAAWSGSARATDAGPPPLTDGEVTDEPKREPPAAAPEVDRPSFAIGLVVRPIAGVEWRPAAVAEASDASGAPVSINPDLAGEFEEVAFEQPIPLAEAQALADDLVVRGLVESAEPNRLHQPAIAPNDPWYASSQWPLGTYPNQSGNYGINVEQAWDVTKGSTTITVAVLDTGILPHGDITGRLVPGIDMISNLISAGDGTGRDGDAFDVGNYRAAGECGIGSPGRGSSFHGLHVAGTIGASTDNGLAMAGVDQRARVQAVRVLGKCGGSDTDVADGMRWAAGLPVAGLPGNATPARVLNLSLGRPGACDAYTQDAINAVTSVGAIVVVAAGNENSDLDLNPGSPANCANVINVAAVDHQAYRSSFSNYGSTVTIAGPGGEDPAYYGNNPGVQVVSLGNTGTQAPIPGGDTFAYQRGTSMAAPHVAGTVSLMLSVNPYLNVFSARALLQATARVFPFKNAPQFQCSNNPGDVQYCGSGMLDAGAAVAAARTATAFAPRAPTGVVASPGSGSATVAWAAPGSNGGPPPTTYVVTASPGGQSCQTGALSCVVPGLANGVSYTFTVTAVNGNGASGPSAPSGAVTPISTVVALTPSRLFDTRTGQGGVAAVKVQSPLRIKVTGRNGVPAGGVAAVSLNVTVTQPDGDGYVTVWPCANAQPDASNLNYVAGQTVPNAVIAPVDGNGEVCLYSYAPAHLIADVNGWFPVGGGFGAVTPSRVFDTRSNPTKVLVPLRVRVTGVNGVPASGVAAVSLNVTVVAPEGDGYVTVWPCAFAQPDASNLNYVAGQTVPNAVIAPVDGNGEVCFYSYAATDLIADVNGWFAAGSGFGAVTPSRLFDTRTGQGGVPAGKVPPTAPLRVRVTGKGGSPTAG